MFSRRDLVSGLSLGLGLGLSSPSRGMGRIVSPDPDPNPDPGPGPQPVLFPISTPLLYEGDSNTDWNYQTRGWAKRALAYSQGRFYVPPAGDFATAGSTISVASANGYGSMEARKDAVVARIQGLVAAFGRCVVWFQIGTNGGDLSNDIPILAGVVAAYKAAGATVYCNLCPEFYPNGYVSGLNAAIRDGAIGIDGHVDVQPVVEASPGKTHYGDVENGAVGRRVAEFLRPRTTTDAIYADPVAGFTVDPLDGSVAASGAGVSGTLPTGWSAEILIGAGTLVTSVSGAGAGRGIDITLTGGSGGAYALLRRVYDVSLAVGDVLDHGMTVDLIEATDDETISHCAVSVGGSSFPYGDNGAISLPNWPSSSVWRGYPVRQTEATTRVGRSVALAVAGGKTAYIRVSLPFHVKREGAAVVTPPVVPAGPAGATWDPTVLLAAWTEYTNGNRTASAPDRPDGDPLGDAGGNIVHVRSANAKSSGLFYWETRPSAGAGVGVCDLGTSNFSGAGQVTCFANGNVFYDGGSGTISAVNGTTDRICVATRADLNLFWVRKNGENWNGSATADPATGVGGFSTGTGAKAIYGLMFGVGNSIDLYTSAADFAFVPPEGAGVFTS